MNFTFIKRIIAKRALVLPAFIVFLSIFMLGALHPSEATAISKPTQSSTVQYQPRITAPNAPTSPTAVAGNVQATITWVAPASNGGAAITGYTVTSSPVVATPTACKAVNALTCIFTGLTNGTSYTFTVAAINSVGTGTSSAATAAVIPSTVPGAPGTPTVVIGAGSAAVTWTAPSSNGGLSITSYNVYNATSNALVCSYTVPVGTSANTCTATGLSPGTSYTFYVKAVNPTGTSAQSASSTAATTPTAPTASATITSTTSSSYQTQTLVWSAVTATGGLPILSYTAYATAVNTPITATGTASLSSMKSCTYSVPTSGATNTCTITGLSDNTQYWFFVLATNLVGQYSALGIYPSNIVLQARSATTASAPTAAAVITTATASGVGAITAVWNAVTATGGLPIHGYPTSPLLRLGLS